MIRKGEYWSYLMTLTRNESLSSGADNQDHFRPLIGLSAGGVVKRCQR